MNPAGRQAGRRWGYLPLLFHSYLPLLGEIIRRLGFCCQWHSTLLCGLPPGPKGPALKPGGGDGREVRTKKTEAELLGVGSLWLCPEAP